MRLRNIWYVEDFVGFSDGEGFDAGRDHRLCQIPPAPSQGSLFSLYFCPLTTCTNVHVDLVDYINIEICN